METVFPAKVPLAGAPPNLHRTPGTTPTDAPLFTLLCDHLSTFLESRNHSPDPKRGFLRPEIRTTFERYLRCGVHAHGVARFRCHSCGNQRLVPLSCRSRGICSRCRQKSTAIWSEWIQTRLLPSVPYRQWVLSLPKCIRVYFRFDPTLKAKLSAILFRVIKEYLRLRTGHADLVPLVVACDQSFGTLLDYTPHLHTLVADGGFTPDGKFVPLGRIPRQHQKDLEDLVRRRTLTWLVRSGKISSAWARKMRSWSHSGFSLHLKTRIPAHDREGLGRLLTYMRRHPFSMRGIHYKTDTQKVIYRAPKIHGGKKRNFAIFSPLEFITALSDHIPHRRKHTIRYYGAAHPRVRKRLFNNASFPAPIAKAEPLHLQKQGRRAWARWIWRIFETDPLACPCGGVLTLHAIIFDRESIHRILEHAGEPTERAILAPARSPPKGPRDGPSAEVPASHRYPIPTHLPTSNWRTYEEGDPPSYPEYEVDPIPTDDDLLLDPP